VHRPFHAIHACNPPDTFFALAMLFRPMGVKFVFDHHDLCPEMYVAKGRERAGVLYRGLVLLERMTLRSADVVIAVNESHRKIALERGGIFDGKIGVVRSGPRRSWADIHAPRPELKRGRKYMVVYLGEMCEQDGVAHMLHAIRTYRTIAPDDTLFAFCGGGPDQPRMKAMAEQMGLGPFSHFTGRIPDETLWEYLSTADAAIDPDPLTEWSNMSTMNKMIEYMAFGRPIVAFDLLEHRRTAQSASLYIPGNDDAAMGRAVRELLLDPGRQQAMSEFGRTRFREELAWEHSEQRLIAMYQQLLGGAVSAAVVRSTPRHPVTSDTPGA
jgi:glycosyltransferase involved in cell wall biosynthesis